MLPTPEVSIEPGATLNVPLLIRNSTSEPAQVALTLRAPAGWSEKAGSARYPVAAHDVYPVQAAVAVSSATGTEWREITFRAQANGKTIGSITLRVNVAPGGLPQ